MSLPAAQPMSEQTLVELLDQTSELVCVSDAAGQITYANRSWLRTLGYSMAEARLLRPADLVAPEHRAGFLDVARRVNRGEVVEGFEAVLIARTGARVVCRGRASARKVDGELVEFRAVYRDVTEERRVAGLRSRLAATLEATADVVCIATRGGEIAFLNRAAKRLIGLPEDADLSALRVPDLHPPRELVHLFEVAVPCALQRGNWNGETYLLAVHGEEIPVSIAIVAHPSVRVGEPSYFYSMVMRDLRERVRMEDTLRESEGRFRGVLENLRLPAMVLDVNGVVTFANDGLLALTGWSRNEIVGESWFDRFVPMGERMGRSALYSEMIAKDASPPHDEYDLLLRAGLLRRIAWDTVALRNPEGRIIGMASVGRDVDAERKTQRLKDQLIATVSHELRSPLSAVHGALRFLGETVPEGKPRKLLEIATRNTDRVLRLAGNLLDIERVEAGTLAMELAATPVAQLVSDTLEIMAEAAGAAGVTLRVRDEAALAPLVAMADADRIVQVLTNLVNNAVKFSPAGGAVVLAAEKDGDVIRIGVRDEGRGIPADKLESIFERFEQVHAADAREKGGAGLGLAISQAIVVKHGGRIWAESVLGTGSVFYLTLRGA